MQTLHIKAENSVMQQILVSLNSLAEAGNKIEVEFLEASRCEQENIADTFLQNEQVIQDIQESLAQIERGETYDQDEAFDRVFKRLGL